MTEKVSLEAAIEVVLRNGPTFETIAGLCKMAVEASQFLAPPMQEPVVWMYQDKNTHEVLFQKHMKSFVDHSRLYETPLYTHPPQRTEQKPVKWADYEPDGMQHNKPPQRTWVGLTDYEIGVCSTEAAMNRSEMVGGAVTFARAIQAKLKEKNNG